jgi:2-C-methyl-D-erythritol 4-phosphate cytidylyltransferase
MDRPKALAALAGRPMLSWSVEAVREVAAVQRIVVALPADWLDAAPEGTVAVAGGAVRSESVRAALRAAGDGDPVIVHDAARPLARSELFERALLELDASEDIDAVIAAVPVPDTIKEVREDSRLVARTLKRSALWAIQTPQVFRRESLQEALSDDVLLAQATDDAWLIEQQGGVVRVIDSGEHNFKVTTPDDLKLAELLLGPR